MKKNVCRQPTNPHQTQTNKCLPLISSADSSRLTLPSPTTKRDSPSGSSTYGTRGVANATKPDTIVARVLVNDEPP